MVRSLIALFVIILLLVVGGWLFNYVKADRPLQRALSADPRDNVVKAQAHFDNWIDPNTLVFNVGEVSGTATRMDVFRCFLEYAEAMKAHHVTAVILAAHGKNKFKVDGDYFQQLGQEYSAQNPMYTIRTFPIHLSTMEGARPFVEYTGGVLGVLQKEMEQFTEFSDRWYVIEGPVTTTSTPSQPETVFDPCAGLRDSNPHCGWSPHWDDSGVAVNAIDGVRTEFLSVESSDADGFDFGKLHYSALRICFENGKLCGGKHAGVSVQVDGMVASDADSQYSTSVRLRFDDERPVRQRWGISDSHDALIPFGHEKQFLSLLVRHNKLILEFSYYEKAARTVTFEIAGLADKMKATDLR